MVALGWFGGRTLFRLAENSFWSLNSLAVQPAYTMCREVLRQLVERRLAARATKAQRARLRAAAALVSGALICAAALAVLAAVLPSADSIRGAAGVGTARPSGRGRARQHGRAGLRLSRRRRAGLGHRRRDHGAAAGSRRVRASVRARARPGASRISRTSTSSANATAFGSRAGGPDRAAMTGSALLAAHWSSDARSEPLDSILITGDMTDAGRSSEWAEFFDAVAPLSVSSPTRMLILPGNHDLNVVDRANPARLDLPTSPEQAAAPDAHPVGDRRGAGRPRAGRRSGDAATRRHARDALTPHRRAIAAFADTGSRCACRRSWRRSVGRRLSDGAAARPRRRARHHSAQLQRRDAFLLHQCARPGLDAAGARLRDCLRALSPRHTGSWRCTTISWSIPSSAKRAVGADRHRADQRQLVRAPASAARPKHRADARPSPHRLDRRMRRRADRLRAVAGHGGDRRDADVLLHPHLRGGGGRAFQTAAPATDHRGGRAKRRGLEPAGSV